MVKFRIYLTENDEGVPFNYAFKLSRILHKWLAADIAYDTTPLYSMGWLSGRQVEHRPSTPQEKREGALFFRGGARWDIGMHDDEQARKLMDLLPDENMPFYGMRIQSVEVLYAPRERFEAGYHRFLANSPVLLRQAEANSTYTHITYRSRQSGALLSAFLRRKMEQAGLAAGDELKLFFDPNFLNAKTRLIDINGRKMKASVCPVVAYAPPEVLEFLWVVGAGELCHLGFGSLDYTE